MRRSGFFNAHAFRKGTFEKSTGDRKRNKREVQQKEGVIRTSNIRERKAESRGGRGVLYCGGKG